MSLQNLAKVGQLLEQAADREETARLLKAARRRLDDAKRADNSAETRYDAAFRVVMLCAIAALRAKGYRLSTSQPGHQQVAIQTLPLTIGLDTARVRRLDMLRRKRNGIDYEGDIVTAAMAEGCTAEAKEILSLVARLLER
jgi:hypothetical protein